MEEKKLVECPDCSNKVSRRAISCPNCGCPVSEILSKKFLPDRLKCPKFPRRLSIGMTENFSGSPDFKATCDYENVVREIKPGKVKIYRHKKGILIRNMITGTDYKIHYSQIIDVRYEDRASLVKATKESKSVVKGAALGGVVFGPLGAIVGAMSQMNTGKIKMRDYLVINFWDTSSKKPQTLLFCGSNLESEFKLFAARVNKKAADGVAYRNHQEIMRGHHK